jgi:hypothetical protein
MARRMLIAVLAILVVGLILFVRDQRPQPPRVQNPVSVDAGHCAGMLCAGICRPRLYGCTVIVRSQMSDRCNAIPAGVGCGPRNPGPALGHCDVGIVNRVLVDGPGDCTETRFRMITAEGCAAYRKKNAGRPLDEFDPDRSIQVTRRFERYDAEGNLVDEPGIGEYWCPRPPPKRRTTLP